MTYLKYTLLIIGLSVFCSCTESELEEVKPEIEDVQSKDLEEILATTGSGA